MNKKEVLKKYSDNWDDSVEPYDEKVVYPAMEEYSNQQNAELLQRIGELEEGNAMVMKLSTQQTQTLQEEKKELLQISELYQTVNNKQYQLREAFNKVMRIIDRTRNPTVCEIIEEALENTK